MKSLLNKNALRTSFPQKSRLNHNLRISSIEDDFNNTYLNIAIENWHNNLKIFLTKWHKINDSGKSFLLRAYAARLLERVYDLYALKGRDSSEFLSDFSLFMYQNNYLSDFIRKGNDHINLPGKRIPSIEESVKATVQRLDAMHEIAIKLVPKVKGILMGGSMSYGPFLNVRSNLFSSDIDVIIVVDHTFFDSDNDWVDVDLSNRFSDDQWQLFVSRKQTFLNLYKDNLADIFSQRFTLRDLNFSISTHFMSLEKFEDLYVNQLKVKDLPFDRQFSLRDYKNNKYEKLTCQLMNFSGEENDYYPTCLEVKSGYIVGLPGAGIKSNRLYPGFYHQIIMPSCTIIIDKDNYCANILGRSMKLMRERVAFEKKQWPSSSFLRSHPRHPVFAPRKYDYWDL